MRDIVKNSRMSITKQERTNENSSVLVYYIDK